MDDYDDYEAYDQYDDLYAGTARSEDEDYFEGEEEPEDEDESDGDDRDDVEPDPDLDEEEYRNQRFADPGGRSALWAASRDNPRIYPCPTCGAPNTLTARDKASHYQCDRCSDAEEGIF